ncbi:hypothetical protein [Adlercreutzia faecimuris]|uniref:Uncharacterized protein n=1 Tax=Adlercreutzia faecimuris TaxID=2897341 RepID=A0ABS9WEB4_9ACTN|nr:hypothetical protein [Adlercreutzia sp. JBNU-10]MCI2240915.1 hypothetical protein [Adlercreutzia sp. JBNU-10]
MNQYFGTYHRFETESKKDAGRLLGADNLVGDAYRIECTMDGADHKAWLVSRFDQRIGFFDPEFSRDLSILSARGLTLTAVLSFIAFTEAPEPGHYWGEMAVMAYDPHQADAFEAFVQNVALRMQDGVRVNVTLSDEGVTRVIESNGTWLPDQTVPMPAKEKGTVVMKSRRSLSEKAIEQGRKGNKGCYIISWAFLLALVAGAMFALKSCGLF